MFGRQTWWCLLEDDDDAGGGNGGGGGGDGGGGSGGAGAGAGDGDAELTKLRNEAAALRARAKEAEKERDQLKAATMSDQEKATKRADEAEAKAKATQDRLEAASLKAEVGLIAGKLGIARADAALRLIDRSAVTFSDGEATSDSVEKALKAAVKEYPFLTRNGTADAGAGGAGGSTGDTAGVGKDAFGRGLNQALRRSRKGG